MTKSFLRWVCSLCLSFGLFVSAIQAQQEDFAKSLEQRFWSEKISGLSLFVLKGDSVLFSGGFGKIRQDRYAPANAKSIFRVGSVGKTVVALGIMRLIGQGRLNLTSSVIDLLPDIPLRNSWEEEHPLQIIHLLEHSSGLEGMHYNETLNKGPNTSLQAALLINPQSKVLQWPPGSRPAYSNLNYALLALILETLSGLPFDEYLQKEVLAPLKMESSGFKPEALAEELHPQGFTERSGPPVPEYNYLLRPAVSFYSSAQDIGQLLRLFLQRGKFKQGDSSFVYLPEAAIRLMERSESSRAAQAGFEPGYGKGLFTGFYKGLKKCWHDGSIPGFFARMVWFPDDGAAYCILGNREQSWSRSFERTLLNELLGRSQMALPLAAQADSFSQTEIEGHYLLANPRDRLLRIADYRYSWIELKQNAEGLKLLTPEGESFSFTATGQKGQFRRANDPSPELMIGRSAKDIPYVQIKGKYYEKQSKFWSQLFSVLLFLAKWLLIPFALFVLANLTFTGIKRRKVDAVFFSRILPFLPLPMLFLALRIHSSLGFADLGQFQLSSLFIFILSLGAPLIAFLGLFAQVKSLKAREHPAVRIFSFFASLVTFALLIYLFSFELLGLRLWMY